MPRIDQAAVRNRLLAALPVGAFAELVPALEPVERAFKQVLHAPDRRSGTCTSPRAAWSPFDRSAGVRAPLLRYAQTFHLQVAQTAACSGRHGLGERLARWLLLAHDRAEGDAFHMTQEFMALMLGVRRAGVSVAAGILQKAGAIAYERGCVTVLDRSGLEAASCGCYRAVRSQLERLLGGTARG